MIYKPQIFLFLSGSFLPRESRQHTQGSMENGRVGSSLRGTTLNLDLNAGLFLYNRKEFCCCSIAKSCLTFCNPMMATTACQASLSITNSQSLLKIMSIESVMPSNHLIPLSSPYPPAFNLSQHQGLFKWVSSSHQMARVLEFQLQHQSFQWTLRTDFLKDGLVGAPCSPRDSQESSPTPQFKSISSSALSLLHSLTLTSIYDYWKKHSLD